MNDSAGTILQEIQHSTTLRSRAKQHYTNKGSKQSLQTYYYHYLYYHYDNNCADNILRALTESEHGIELDTQACSDDALKPGAWAEEPRVLELSNAIKGSVKADGVEQPGKRWEDEYEDEVDFGVLSDSKSMGVWCFGC